MVGFFPGSVAKTEAIKDFETPALEPVGLAAKDLGVAFVDDARADAEVGHPAGGHETGVCKKVSGLGILKWVRWVTYPAGPAPMMRLRVVKHLRHNKIRDNQGVSYTSTLDS